MIVEELDLLPPHALIPDSAPLNCWRKVSPVEPGRAAVVDTELVGDVSRDRLAAAAVELTVDVCCASGVVGTAACWRSGDGTLRAVAAVGGSSTSMWSTQLASSDVMGCAGAGI